MQQSFGATKKLMRDHLIQFLIKNIQEIEIDVTILHEATCNKDQYAFVKIITACQLLRSLHEIRGNSLDPGIFF